MDSLSVQFEKIIVEESKSVRLKRLISVLKYIDDYNITMSIEQSILFKNYMEEFESF